MAKINYDDKVSLNVQPVPEINKVTDSNMNEIKSVVNNNDDQTTVNTANIAQNAADIATKQDELPSSTADQYFNGLKLLADFDPSVRASLLTGFIETIGTILPTDTVLEAFEKAQGQITVNANLSQDNALNKLSLSGGTMTGPILGDQEIRGFRPVGAAILFNTNLEALNPNSFYEVNAGFGTVTISVTDTANTNFPIGTEFEFSPVNLTNDIIFAGLGSQVIQSFDGNLKLDGVYSGSVLKKLANNTWILIGRLKA